MTQESVHLTWTEAVDDVGVVAYRAYNEDALMAELSATGFEVEGLILTPLTPSEWAETPRTGPVQGRR